MEKVELCYTQYAVIDGLYYLMSENNHICTQLGGFTSIEEKYWANIFIASKDDKYGCLNRKGRIVIPFENDDIEIIDKKNGIFICRKTKIINEGNSRFKEYSYDLLDNKGNVVIKGFDNFDIISNIYVLLIKDEVSLLLKFNDGVSILYSCKIEKIPYCSYGKDILELKKKKFGHSSIYECKDDVIVVKSNGMMKAIFYTENLLPFNYNNNPPRRITDEYLRIHVMDSNHVITYDGLRVGVVSSLGVKAKCLFIAISETVNDSNLYITGYGGAEDPDYLYGELDTKHGKRVVFNKIENWKLLFEKGLFDLYSIKDSSKEKVISLSFPFYNEFIYDRFFKDIDPNSELTCKNKYSEDLGEYVLPEHNNCVRLFDKPIGYIEYGKTWSIYDFKKEIIDEEKQWLYDQEIHEDPVDLGIDSYYDAFDGQDDAYWNID